MTPPFQAPSEEDVVAGRDPRVMRGYILAWAHRTDILENPGATSKVTSGGSASSSCAADQTRPADASNRKVPQGVTIGRRRYRLQVPDYTAGKQTHVCRGVWSPGWHNQCDMFGVSSILVAFTLESTQGPQTGAAMVRATTTVQWILQLDQYP